MLGFPKKKDKFVKKAITPTLPKPSITKKLKEEFGPLNEWTEKPTGPKRWSKPFDSNMTEFEKKEMNEGPAYEYDKYVSAIEKNYKNYWKSVTNFADVLHNKGLEKESKMIERSYIKQVKKWNDFFVRQVRKLM